MLVVVGRSYGVYGPFRTTSQARRWAAENLPEIAFVSRMVKVAAQAQPKPKRRASPPGARNDARRA